MIKLITDEGKRKSYLVHRLVAIAFVPNPYNEKEVNHKDTNVMNNVACNLEWCSRKYNLEYSHILDNPVKNHLLCHVEYDGKVIEKFTSIRDAAIFAANKYNVSLQSLIKYREIKGTTIKIIGPRQIQKKKNKLNYKSVSTNKSL